MNDPKQLSKLIDQAINVSIEHGVPFEDIQIITSYLELAPHPGYLSQFRSVYGDTSITYDPCLPPRTIYVGALPRIKPLSLF